MMFLKSLISASAACFVNQAVGATVAADAATQAVGATTMGKVGFGLINVGISLGAMTRPIMAAAANDPKEMFADIVSVICMLLLIAGLICVAYGFWNLKQGENGMIQIVAGLGMALTYPLQAWFFKKNIGDSVVIQPGPNP
jgi:hypothetical protein